MGKGEKDDLGDDDKVEKLTDKPEAMGDSTPPCRTMARKMASHALAMARDG
jgi:hypothetical protein